MNAVDVGIAVLVVALAVIGFQRGLVASALPLAGFIGGAALGARVGQALLPGGSESEYAALVAVVGGLVLGALVAVTLDGLAGVLRSRLAARGVLAGIDGAGGAVLLGALGLVLAWGLGAIALNAPGPETRQIREAAQRSTVLAALNELMPPSGPILNVIRRIDPRPALPGPPARVGPPDPGIVADPDVEAAAESTVRVLGTACGLGVAGSGWVAAPDLVVTNAHVVAGQDDTSVSPPSGGELDADAVHYDTRNDLAVMHVPGLGAPALSLRSGRPGTPGAVIGYPENGPLTASPARLGETRRTVSQDSYGRGPVRRAISTFRAAVRSGNSGGPVVDGNGRVLTTVFAATRGSGPPSGLGVPNRIVRDALGGALSPVDTGPCA